jgi:D-arginine dehydrogenase
LITFQGIERVRTHYDFMVIGAGIAGASLAYELAPFGSVCLVEAESRPGYHATGRSAALFAPSYGGAEIRALTRASAAFMRAPPAGFSDSPLLAPRGCLYVARRDQLLRLESMVQETRASGGRIMLLDEGAARGFVPSLQPGYVAAAAFDQDATDIDVDAIHQGFLRGGRSAGTRLITDCRVGQLERQHGLWKLPLADGPVSAPVLINAAGAWADQVAAACGAQPVGLEALRRTALLVDPPPGIDVRSWPAVIDADERFYFKPDAGKLLLSPADESPQSAGDAQPDDLDVALAVDRVQRVIDLDVRRVNHRWAGLRTFAPDRVPVLGFDAQVPGFFWCAGQGGYGIQSAPALARTAASLLLQRSLPQDVADEGLDVSRLAPARFQSGTTGLALAHPQRTPAQELLNGS